MNCFAYFYNAAPSSSTIDVLGSTRPFDYYLALWGTPRNIKMASVLKKGNKSTTRSDYPFPKPSYKEQELYFLNLVDQLKERQITKITWNIRKSELADFYLECLSRFDLEFLPED